MCLCCVIKCEQEIEAEDTYLAVPKHVRTLSYPFTPTLAYTPKAPPIASTYRHRPKPHPHSTYLSLPSLLCPLPCSC
jgi:hypothetical protein